MPRPDASKLIADNIGHLPGADGTTMRLFNFSSFGQEPKTQARIKGLAQEVGDRIIHLLEQHKYSLHHPGDPTPADRPGPKHGRLHCQTCGLLVIKFVLDDRLQAAIPKTALEGMALHDCTPDRPRADTPADAGYDAQPSGVEATDPASGDGISQEPGEVAGDKLEAAAQRPTDRRRRRPNHPSDDTPGHPA